ncbi:MAG: hypothetical protein LBE51_06740 [Acidovorax sp.]|nr:hypothetical protein [Acidovorax sp.]
MNHKQRKAARRRAAQIRRNAEALERTCFEQIRLTEAFRRVQVLSALKLLQHLAEELELSTAIQQSAQQTKH